MKILLADQAPRSAAATAVRFRDTRCRDPLPVPVPAAEFSGKRLETLRCHSDNSLIIGLGDAPDRHALRDAAATAASLLAAAGQTRATLDLAAWPEDWAPAAIEGFVLGAYRFEEFKTTKTPRLAAATAVLPARASPAARRAARDAATVARAVNEARDLGNLPGNVINPGTLAGHARRLARNRNLRATVLDTRALEQGRFGGILAVGKGSAHAPRLICLEYRGPNTPANSRPLALVGKAVTFDTGGLCIKPRDGMAEMIFDKSGGVAVLGTLAALADLGRPGHVVGIVPAAENMPDAAAFRPGDIIRMHDGTPVEIADTDAEGRLLVADAVCYARSRFRASAIIDLATLTGACGVALGRFTAGLWATSDTLLERIRAAAAAAGESVWHMPLGPEYEEANRSDIAEIKNYGGRMGGACTGAAFIRRFAGDTPWAHLDIAYPASLDKPRHGLVAGATGFGIRTLVALATTS